MKFGRRSSYQQRKIQKKNTQESRAKSGREKAKPKRSHAKGRN